MSALKCAQLRCTHVPRRVRQRVHPGARCVHRGRAKGTPARARGAPHSFPGCTALVHEAHQDVVHAHQAILIAVDKVLQHI